MYYFIYVFYEINQNIILLMGCGQSSQIIPFQAKVPPTSLEDVKKDQKQKYGHNIQENSLQFESSMEEPMINRNIKKQGNKKEETAQSPEKNEKKLQKDNEKKVNNEQPPKKLTDKDSNKQEEDEQLEQSQVIVDPTEVQPFLQFKISNEPNSQIPVNIGPLRQPTYKVQAQFSKKDGKLIKGDSTEKNQAKEDILVIQESDCLGNFCLVSLSDGNYCHTEGSYNSNNWWVQTGTIAGLQAYKIHPPQSKPKECLCSRHCLAFRLAQKRSYSVYRIENQSLTQVSEIVSEEVNPNSWNLVTNIVVSELSATPIYFIYPLESSLPASLAPKINNKKDGLSLDFKYQKLLPGQFSKQSQRGNPISPIIKKTDCFDNFGIVCLEDEWSHYCNTNGDHNSNVWIVEKYSLGGIDAYRLHPPMLRAKKSLGSRHCITFFLKQKEDFNIFAIQKGVLSQVSFISAGSVKQNDWNLLKQIQVSQLSTPIIYFVYPTKKKLPSELQGKAKKTDQGYYFDTYCQKMLPGEFSKEHESQQSKKRLIRPADCLVDFGIISLSDGNYCHTGGNYNSNNWFVEKGTLLGVESYRVQPPKSRPIQCLCSRHCVMFYLTEKKDYSVYKIQNGLLSCVSYLSAQSVQEKEWNMIDNLTISQLKSTVIFFAFPLESKLPPELTIKSSSTLPGKISFIRKCQKLLTGEFSKESEKSNPASPIIKAADCFEDIGIISVEDDYSRYCSCNGDYNYNNWIIQKGTLAGLQAFKIHPPLSKPKNGLGSRHCISFLLKEKKDYNVFKVQNGKICQSSFIPAEQVKVNNWNMQPSELISQILAPVIYFVYPSEKKLPSQLVPKIKKRNIKKFDFEPYCKKVLTGKFSKQHESQSIKQPLFKPADILCNFGVISLSDGNYCHTGGQYNSNNWVVEKGMLYGVQVYRVHPPQSKPTQCLCSRHSIVFNLPDKKDYCFFKIQKGLVTQVSHLLAQVVKPNNWNIINNLDVNQIEKPVTYFSYPLDLALPAQLTPTKVSTKLPFSMKYQKLLTGKHSRESLKQKPEVAFIRSQDCFENFSIICLQDEYTRYCNTNGDHNYTNYIIEKGVLAGMEAYRVHPPLNKPNKNFGSRHCIAFLLQQKANYKIYRIKQTGVYTQIGCIFSEEVKIGEYNPSKNFSISQIKAPLTFFIAKQSPQILSLLSSVSLREEYEPYSIQKQKEKYFSNKKNSDFPMAKLLKFIKQDQKFLIGRFSKEKSNNGMPSPLILPPDCFYSSGIICLQNNNGTGTCGQWNSNDWIIQKGHVEGTQAYRIHPPEHFSINEYVTYQHCIILKFPTKQDYIIQKIVQGFNNKVEEISASQIIPNEYKILKNIKISELTSPLTLLIQKPSNRLSSYSLKNNMQVAVIYQDSNVSIKKYLLQVPENPHTPLMFNYGPGVWQCIYPINRRFFVFNSQNKEIIVWSNSDDSAITMTQFDYRKLQIKNIRLQCKKGLVLGSATGDEKYIYYTIVYPEKAGDVNWSVQMHIIKADIDNGQIYQEKQLATDKYNLNIHKFQNSHLVISGNLLALFVTRTMTQAADKLNHQGGYVAVISTETLEMVFQSVTSSHSFGQSLIVRKDGRFCGIDQGDVGPRGINYWVFDKSSISNKVVYNYKTYHGTKEANPSGIIYPLYEEISTPERKFYQWSNDNSTYTEIAAPGIHEAQDGFYIFFAGENIPNPLDLSQIDQTDGGYLCGTRNLGYIKTRKEICQKLSEFILTKGPTYYSQYYEYSGRLEKQQVTGVQWITNLPKGQNISRLKTCMLGNKMLLIYEIWTKKSYIRTEYMVLNLDSGNYTEPKVLPSMVRLYRADDIFLCRNNGVDSAVIFCGQNIRTIGRFEISLLSN